MAPRLGILLSGAGSTYANLVAHIAAGRLSAEIAVVVGSRADAGGLERARGFGHVQVIARDATAVTAALLDAQAEWVAMCGWVRFWDPPPPFRRRTINVHPALLPSFGGKGMYGEHVHAAVLAHGCKLSGCTVHLVGGDYDSGPILAQRAVPVLPDDTPATLQARVQDAERELYPRALAALLGGGLRQGAQGWWLDGLDDPQPRAPIRPAP